MVCFAVLKPFCMSGSAIMTNGTLTLIQVSIHVHTMYTVAHTCTCTCTKLMLILADLPYVHTYTLNTLHSLAYYIHVC